MLSSDKELIILESIYKNKTHIRQRNLARIAGLSLGMTNSIIKRLVNKGWLMIRKLNNRNIFYAVTPEGLDVITRKSFHYLKRTIKHIVQYKELLAGLLSRIQKNGYPGIVLIGKSDISFIIEHLCSQCHLKLLIDDLAQADVPAGCDAYFLLFSEAFSPDEPVVSVSWEKYKQTDNWAYLRELMLHEM